MKPPRNEPSIRVVMMPRDTNAQGNIFGGVILSYIDQAAFVEARYQSNRRFVTVMMNKVEFHKPVHVGDVLALYARTTKIGRTSIQIHVNAVAQRCDDPEIEVQVTEADVVFVAVDAEGRPIPVLDD
jgi:acyl-CoA thioesterase YciA